MIVCGGYGEYDVSESVLNLFRCLRLLLVRLLLARTNIVYVRINLLISTAFHAYAIKKFETRKDNKNNYLFIGKNGIH